MLTQVVVFAFFAAIAWSFGNTVYRLMGTGIRCSIFLGFGLLQSAIEQFKKK